MFFHKPQHDHHWWAASVAEKQGAQPYRKSPQGRYELVKVTADAGRRDTIVTNRDSINISSKALRFPPCLNPALAQF